MSRGKDLRYPGRKRITVEVSDTVFSLLESLAKGEGAPASSVEGVVLELIDHAQQGVYRPGAWERDWIKQVFFQDWEDTLAAGDPYGREGCEGIFQKPAVQP